MVAALALVVLAVFIGALLALVSASAVEDGVAMRRFYNPYTGEHFYTESTDEANNLAMHGWEYEGVGWYAPRAGAPVYRLYNPWVIGGDHHYALSSAKRAHLVACGWWDEGVGWYSVSGGGGDPISGSTTLMLLRTLATTRRPTPRCPTCSPWAGLTRGLAGVVCTRAVG